MTDKDSSHDKTLQEREKQLSEVMRRMEAMSGESFEDFNEAFERYVSKSDEELKAGWPDLSGIERALVLYAIFFFLLTPVLLLWPVAFAYIWQRLQSGLSSFWVRFGVTSALLLVGIGLFYVREELRRLYGAVEVLVGAAAVWFGLTPKADEVAATLAVASGVYVIVRGLDNYARGTEQTLKAMELVKDDVTDPPAATK